MKLLLDTHMALWLIGQPSRIAPQASEMLADAANTVHVSIVTLWEIAIKYRLKRGRRDDINIPSAEARSYFEQAGYEFLPIRAEHALRVEQLPPIHGDPFDRMLVAQALHEPLTLVTHDKRVAAYSNSFLLV